MEEQDEKAWVLFYTSIMGWQYHPGYNKEGTMRLTTRQAADLADQMLAEFQARREQWAG